MQHNLATRTTGFLGEPLRTQRTQAFLTQEQQRASIGIASEQYDKLWLRLQAMPLPLPNLFVSDLARIVASVQAESGIVATNLDLAPLEALIRAGLLLDYEGILPPEC